jgi:hypothetical protein
MAAPLSTTASIAALLDLCGKVLKYLRDMKDALKVCKRLTVELSASRGILNALSETVQDAEASPQDAWSATIRSLDIVCLLCHLNGFPVHEPMKIAFSDQLIMVVAIRSKYVEDLASVENTNGVSFGQQRNIP